MNLSEKKLFSILGSHYWNYNGHGKISFDGFKPDFICKTGQKKIIELNGCFWHCCSLCGFGENVLPNGLSSMQVFEKDITRIETFARFGFSTMVIWEHDLEHRAHIDKRVRNFLRE